MGFRIFVSGSGIAKEAEEVLLSEGCRIETGDPRDTPEDLSEKLGEFDPNAIIARQGKFTATVLNAAQALQVICKHGVGTDNIDIEAATQRQIPVLITPGINSESVAEHALALIMCLMRRIPAQDSRIRKGLFDKKGYDGLELSGKTLGIVGFGRIGRRLCELVAPFNMTVLVFDPLAPVEPLGPSIQRVSAVEELFSNSDFISLHCPLTPETMGIIRQESMAQMKQSVCIINTSRGGLVVEQDLCHALETGAIGGAALDVFEVEPLSQECPLLALDNVVLSPHVAGMSDISFKNMGLHAAKNVLAVLRGGTVDPAACVNDVNSMRR